MKEIYLHPLPLRVWHWVNALMIMILIVTGIRLRISGIAALRSHDPYLVLHLYAGWAMAASSLFWFTYAIASGHLRRHFLMKNNDLAGILRQVRYYAISIFKGDKDPFAPSAEQKYNPLQKLAYGSVMLIIVPVQVITGLCFSHIGILRGFILYWNMAGLLDAVHVIVAYVFILYLIVHIYMATLGPTAFSHILAMITGFAETGTDPAGEGETLNGKVTL
ncbi:MAG: thiosulfate reductase cytochrome b subunit [Syntrophus sp. SKADARSKE-3]|nr:thiosulfate reductase cytochrome b subunit [Syntrophus sp. SKADARSKE-3]